MNDRNGVKIVVGDAVKIRDTGSVLIVREIDAAWPKSLTQMCRCDNAKNEADSNAKRYTHAAWCTSQEIEKASKP